MMTFVNGQGVKVSDHEAILGRAQGGAGGEDAAATECPRGAARPRDRHPEGHGSYTWRAKYRQASGVSVPAHDRPPERWSTEDKFAVVLETAALSEAELSAYCRRKGLYAEQIEAWKQACRRANGPQTLSREEHTQRQAQARRIQALEAELRRKDQALAETAALLVLTKKVQALWEVAGDATSPSQSAKR
jgi:transposase